MAVSDAMKAAGQAAPKAPVTPAQPAPKGKKDDALRTAFVAEGAKVREAMSDDEKAVEGSKSDTLEFICALGDPSVKQNRTENKTSIPSYAVIGVKMRFKEDATCPFAPLAENCKNTTDTVAITEVPVKAGDVVALNLTEYAALLSKVEYGGMATGGEKKVRLGCTVSNAEGFPLPNLKLEGQAKGSYKEGMELIADVIGGTDGTRKTFKVKEEYAEKFGAWYNRKKMSKTSAAAPKAKGENAKNIAAAFRVALAKKQA